MSSGLTLKVGFLACNRERPAYLTASPKVHFHQDIYDHLAPPSPSPSSFPPPFPPLPFSARYLPQPKPPEPQDHSRPFNKVGYEKKFHSQSISMRIPSYLGLAYSFYAWSRLLTPAFPKPPLPSSNYFRSTAPPPSARSSC